MSADDIKRLSVDPGDVDLHSSTDSTFNDAELDDNIISQAYELYLSQMSPAKSSEKKIREISDDDLMTLDDIISESLKPTFPISTVTNENKTMKKKSKGNKKSNVNGNNDETMKMETKMDQEKHKEYDNNTCELMDGDEVKNKEKNNKKGKEKTKKTDKKKDEESHMKSPHGETNEDKNNHNRKAKKDKEKCKKTGNKKDEELETTSPHAETDKNKHNQDGKAKNRKYNDKENRNETDEGSDEFSGDNDLCESSFIATVILMEIFDTACKKTKSLNRWRNPQPGTWKVNVAKSRRAEGLPYETGKKIRNPKVPKAINCSKCKFHCTDNFSEECRISLCRKYWSLEFVGKKNFILANIDIKKPKTILVERKRETTRTFSTQCFFFLNDEKVQVCQKFFCATLCIAQSVVSDAVKKRDLSGQFGLEHDQRGRHEPPNKTTPEKMAEVRKHIESFPTMESHYVRKDIKRRYLDKTLSIGKMYSLYAELCEKKNVEPVSETIYRRVFGQEYNLGFFIPKKDQCLLCTKYSNSNDIRNDLLKKEYDEHIQRKEICNNEKSKDKSRAQNEENFVSVTFDLQAILQIPCGDVGLLYYTRKLTVYNLTIYESAEPNEAYCCTWTELNGKKGSAEIGSILLYYLSNCLLPNVNEVSLFSDTCGGQNRNKYVAALLLWAVQKIGQLNIIEQKFLESGHTYMEADSMHSSIESAKQNTAIYSINEWINVFKRARAKGSYKKGKKTIKKQPYHVKEFKYQDFKDLKDLAEKILHNTTKDTDGRKVQWLKIKRLRFIKGEMKILYNYDMSENFRTIDTLRTQTEPQTQVVEHEYGTRTKRRKLTASTSTVSTRSPVIPDKLAQLYDAPLTISLAKKKDLLILCNKGVIPEEYHAWYQSLKADDNEKDKLPEPTLSDPDDSEED